MKHKSDLNESVRAFYKDGSEKDFKSLEEASKVTGLTIS